MFRQSMAFLFLGLCLLISTAMANSALPSPTNSLIPIDKTIAVVNDEIVTESELTQAIENTTKQFQQAGRPLPDSQTLHKEILNQIIYTKLQLQIAKKFKLDVNDAQINQAIENIAKRNQLTTTEFKKKLQEHKISLADFKKQIKMQLLVAQVQQSAVSKDITVNNDDIQQFKEKYKTQLAGQGKQYKVDNILIAFPDNASDAQKAETKAKAKTILNQLNHGANFQALQKQYGGSSLGWQALANMPDIFANAVKSMKVNSISNLIEAGNGYHIVKLAGIQGSNTNSLTNEQIQQMVYREKFNIALVKWLKELEKTAYIKIMN